MCVCVCVCVCVCLRVCVCVCVCVSVCVRNKTITNEQPRMLFIKTYFLKSLSKLDVLRQMNVVC